ncbi:small GTPase superfamily [Limtongia smithiae]|uniref:small GTPase superfamily n=1 Tax=Limtongia smithiae TaxID=1125753 RepID=UPI0034CE66C6
MSARDVIRRKLVIVGDGACGKTSLLSVFTLGEFPKDHLPTVFETYVTDCRVDGKSVQLALWDTAGQEEYERLRPLSYSKAHVILVAFAVDTRDSLENVSSKWITEINELCPNIPFILVGLKKDLRTDPHVVETMKHRRQRFVSAAEAELVARQVGARRYIECSALTGENVDSVFEAATRASLLVGQGQQSPCCCLIS